MNNKLNNKPFPPQPLDSRAYTPRQALRLEAARMAALLTVPGGDNLTAWTERADHIAQWLEAR